MAKQWIFGKGSILRTLEIPNLELFFLFFYFSLYLLLPLQAVATLLKLEVRDLLGRPLDLQQVSGDSTVGLFLFKLSF